MNRLFKKIICVISSFLLVALPFTAMAASSLQAGGATGTVYCNFREITDPSQLQNGQTYLFTLERYTANDCIVALPTGSARLTMTATENTSKSYMQKSIGKIPDKYVEVAQKGTGFDTCPSGGIVYTTLNEKIASGNMTNPGTGWFYYCYRGGCQAAGVFYCYQYDAKSFTDQDVTVTPKATVTSTGPVTLTKNDITVSITVGGKTYTVSNYDLTDGSVNYRGHDDTIAITFAGVRVDAKVDMTGIARQAWLEDHEAILDKTTVGAGDIAAIQDAITKGEQNDEVTSGDLNALKDKLAAAQWQDQYKDAISLDHPSVGDYEAINKADEAFKALPDSVQQYIDQTVSKNFTDAVESVDQQIETNSNTFVKDYVSDSNSQIYTAVTPGNAGQIIGGSSAYDGLTAIERQTINDKLAGATGKTYPQLLAEAKAVGFLDQNMTGDNGIYTAVDSKNVDHILAGQAAYGQLDADAKAAVNAKLSPKTYEQFIQEANDFVASSSAQFVNGYVSDKNGSVYPATTTANIDQILSGKSNWDALSQAEKDAVDAKLTAGGSKPYSQLINEAKALIQATRDSFIDSFLSDKDGGVYPATTTKNIDQILSGKSNWDALSQAEKDAIDAKLTAGGSKPYSQLIKEADALIQATQDSFVDSFLSDEAGNIYPGTVTGNIDQILSGKADWDNLSQAEQDAIDAKLTAEGSKPYSELITEAETLVQETQDSFIDQYLSDEDGNIYTATTTENIDQILSGKADWDNLSQTEQDAIDAKLVAEGSKPYSELIAEADTLVQETQDSFIDQYLSDKDGSIYTEATTENIDQILSGKADWDALSQTEKDAIDAKLVAEGSKPYSELIAQAEALVQETQASFIDQYLSDEDGSIYTEATTENIDQILSGKADWDALSQTEKDAIDAKLVAEGSKPYSELIAEADTLVQATQDSFIKQYLTGKDGGIYTKATTENIDQILSGKADWDALSQAEKDAIDAKLVAEGGKPYSELIAQAEAIVRSAQDSFIKQYLTGKDGSIYTEATTENIDQILSGKADWDKLTQAEQDAIDAKLVAEGGKPYSELIAQAAALVQKSQDSFIKQYLTGKDGGIYTEATAENFDQILSGKAGWDKLSQAEKDAVNAKLIANGGVPYEQLLQGALTIQAQMNASPDTGDNAAALITAALALVMGCGIALSVKKKTSPADAGNC